MRKSIRIGVLGLGRMGQIHCQLISRCEGLRLVAGSSKAGDLRKNVAERFAIRTYDDHEALLRDPEVEWIVVATTTDRHREWALKAIQHGKNLIIEKPIALSLDEAKQVVSAADRAGVLTTVYNSRRWDADFQLIRRLLAEETLGEVYRFESRCTGFQPGWGSWGAQGEDNPWRLRRAFGGGMLNDWAPHLFDQILLLVDSPIVSVFGKLYNKIWSEEVDDHFWSELLFENGVSALIEASNNHRIALPRWYIVGTEGAFLVQGGDPGSWGPALIRRSSGKGIEEIRHELPQVELSAGYYQDFVKALQSGTPLPVQPMQALKVMKTIDAVRRSNSTGQSISGI